LEFFEDLALHSRQGATTVLSLQQAGQSACLERVHPVEKPAATDAQLFGNLRSG
jgi:hypothetical protein